MSCDEQVEERICEKDTVRRERAKRERNGHRWKESAALQYLHWLSYSKILAVWFLFGQLWTHGLIFGEKCLFRIILITA